MTIWQKLAKRENQLQKSPPGQIFDDLVPRRAQKPQKSTKKQAEKTAKFMKPPKHQKFSKKALIRLARRNAQTVGRIMDGEEDMPKLKKYGKNGRQKLKPKMERRTGKFLGSSSTPTRGAADRFAHTAGPG